LNLICQEFSLPKNQRLKFSNHSPWGGLDTFFKRLTHVESSLGCLVRLIQLEGITSSPTNFLSPYHPISHLNPLFIFLLLTPFDFFHSMGDVFEEIQ